MAQLPVDLPGPQALADTAALLAAVEQLHAAALGRVADVDARKLHTLDGAPSTGTWIAQQQTSLDRGQVALARRLPAMPLLDEAVRSGVLSVAVAARVGAALAELRAHVDRPDGLIDGQPAEQVLVGVIGHGVRDLVCQAQACLAEDHPRLASLLAELDLETGELLHTVPQAELAVDEENAQDTAALAVLREQGWQAGDPLPAQHGPRSLRQKRHDALTSALRRLLDSGAVGTRDEVAPHLAVTVGIDLLHGAPGALPAVAASGARLPASLVRSWCCDSAVTRFVLGLGRRVLEASHTARTLEPHERRLKDVGTGGRCQAAGCRCGPGRRLVPHHAVPWSQCRTTRLDDRVALCAQSHHDLHSGGHVQRLKDGRWLRDDGWTHGPAG